MGYFSPHERSRTTACGIYNIDNLGEYESYWARLTTDSLGEANYEFAQQEKFILKIDRQFVQTNPG